MGCASSKPLENDPVLDCPVPEHLKPIVAQLATATTFKVTCGLNGDVNMIPIARALKRNSPNLTQLDLSNCRLYSRGAIMIAQVLEANTPLTMLNLSGNSIAGYIAEDERGHPHHPTPEGPIALADALKTNTTLTYLDLSNNLFSPQSTWKNDLQEQLNRRATPLQIIF